MAAKAAAPRTAPRQVALGTKSVYTVLGSRLRDAKKVREEREREMERAREVVVEDWEVEAGREELADGEARGKRSGNGEGGVGEGEEGELGAEVRDIQTGKGKENLDRDVVAEVAAVGNQPSAIRVHTPLRLDEQLVGGTELSIAQADPMPVTDNAKVQPPAL